MGLCNGAVPYTLINWAEMHIDSGLAAILIAAMPLFTVVLAHFLTPDERFNWMKLVGVFLGLIGVAVLMGPAVLKGIGSNILGQLAVVAAALSYAVAAICGRRFKDVTPLVSATGQLMGAALLTAPLSIIVDTPWKLSPLPLSVGALVCLSILGTALAYLLYYYLLARIGATHLSLVTYLIPVTGVMWGALLLKERLHWSAFLGLALILVGIAGVNDRLPRLSLIRRNIGVGRGA
jgi:drug/metabolite transporter (DMT)-like permease